MTHLTCVESIASLVIHTGNIEDKIRVIREEAKKTTDLGDYDTAQALLKQIQELDQAHN